MRNLKNKSCPVCKNEFTENDDVVYCPECGTPHHRECWNLIGHCVNKGLHSANYSYYFDNLENEQTDPENDEEFGEAQSAPPLFIEISNDSFREFVNDSETIDGESIADVAATVKINSKRFVSKFKKMQEKGGKAGWNWGAFFFGAYYLLYRKMYKLGIAMFCINLTIQYLTSFFALKFAPEFMGALTSIGGIGSVSPSYDDLQKAMQSAINASDYLIAQKIFMAMLGAMVLISIILAIFTDHYYKNTVISIIRQVKEQISNGASFSQSPFMMGPMPPMNQDQMRMIYLSRRGGTSLFAPLLAILASTFI